MSVRDNEKVLIVTDCLTGNVITNIELNLYNLSTVEIMLRDIAMTQIDNEHGFMLKVGYNS